MSHKQFQKGKQYHKKAIKDLRAVRKAHLDMAEKKEGESYKSGAFSEILQAVST